MRAHRLGWGVTGLIVTLGLGCAHARLVEKHSGGGGVVAIPDSTSTRSRRKAEELMARHCPAGYVIEREQEVIVGTVTRTDTTVDRKGAPLLAAMRILPVTEDVQETTTQTDVKEWRIWFRPKDAPPTIVPAAATAVPAAPASVVPAAVSAPK